MQTSASHPLISLREVFLKDEYYAVSLLAAALKLLPVDVIQNYEARSIRLELQELLKISFIPIENFDKLMAAITVFSTDLYFRDVASFNDLTNILANSPTAADEFEPPFPTEIAVAIYQARLIDPMDGDNDFDDFSEDIKLYMGSILAENGYLGVPPSINMAIIPDYYLANSQSFMSDAAILPAMLDNTALMIKDLEEAFGEEKALIEQQLEMIKKLDISDIVKPNQ